MFPIPDKFDITLVSNNKNSEEDYKLSLNNMNTYSVKLLPLPRIAIDKMLDFEKLILKLCQRVNNQSNATARV